MASVFYQTSCDAELNYSKNYNFIKKNFLEKMKFYSDLIGSLY